MGREKTQRLCKKVCSNIRITNNQNSSIDCSETRFIEIMEDCCTKSDGQVTILFVFKLIFLLTLLYWLVYGLFGEI